MKNTLIVLSFYWGISAFAQEFNEEFYSAEKYHPTLQTGAIRSENDTLAAIYFKSPQMYITSYYPGTFTFHGDTLTFVELKENAIIGQQQEFSVNKGSTVPSNQLNVVYQMHYTSGGYAAYDSLFFEMDGKKYPNTKQCDSHCTVIDKPETLTNNQLNIWTGSTLLETYVIDIPEDANALNLYSTMIDSKGMPWDNGRDKIPDTVEIHGKNYVLDCRMNIQESTYLYSPNH